MFFHLLESAGCWEAIGADAVPQVGPSSVFGGTTRLNHAASCAA